MKRFLWLLLAGIADLVYLTFQSRDPFGYRFWIPFYVLLLLVTGTCTLAGILFFARRRRIAKLSGLVLLLAATLFFCVFLAILIDYRLLIPGFPAGSPLNNKWSLDFAILKKELKKHPAFQDSLDESIFDSESFRFVHEDSMLVDFMRLTAKINDGHTYMHGFQPAIKSRYFPLLGYFFSDGYFVARASNKYSHLVGAKVLAINNTPIDRLLVEINSITGSENEWQAKLQFDQLLFSANVLHGLGVIPDTNECQITIAQSDGHTSKISLTSEPFFSYFYWALKPISATETSPAIMNIRKPNYLLMYDSSNQFTLLYFHTIQHQRGYSISSLAKDFDTLIQQHHGKIIIDLRNNLGGNNELNHYLVEVLSRYSHIRPIYVLVGRKTFSAAVNLLSELKNKTNIIIVGEPTGAGPNHYGDARHVWLPNTKLSFFISTKKWTFDSLRRDSWYAPDIAVDYSHSDYQRSFDPWLEAVLNNDSGKL